VFHGVSIPHEVDPLTRDALKIWEAGVRSVAGDRLVAEAIDFDGRWLRLADEHWPLDEIDRLLVVGGGKAGAAMAIGLERKLGETLCRAKQLSGWVNVPEGNVETPQFIHLCHARPIGCNEPTALTVTGTLEILNRVRGCGPRDGVIVLLSGGASALLCAPKPPATLADKQAVARLLSKAGANISEMNSVRRRLSLVKGGGLANAISAGRVCGLVISDVLGDDLAVIGSGPLTVESAGGPDPREVLSHFDPHGALSPRVYQLLEETNHRSASFNDPQRFNSFGVHVIGNNAAAIDAAGIAAVELGYPYVLRAARASEPDVRIVAEQWLQAARQLGSGSQVWCDISGGEPTVSLPAAGAAKGTLPGGGSWTGKGGRNQQLVLDLLLRVPMAELTNLVFVSGGTDGEDGPTDAAGAYLDRAVAQRSEQLGLVPREFAASFDAYNFFAAAGGLLKTGSTGTNVCDLRVVLHR
jgi:hydroxypyruvate reductase